jgi:hypothetical protein
MAKLIKTEGNYRIYELDQKECSMWYREYPTLVAWDGRYPELVGDMTATENEASTLEEMLEWIKEWG